MLFYIDEKNNSVELTDNGIKEMTGLNEDPTFFTLPDIATDLAAVESDTSYSLEEKTGPQGAVI